MNTNTAAWVYPMTPEKIAALQTPDALPGFEIDPSLISVGCRVIGRRIARVTAHGSALLDLADGKRVRVDLIAHTSGTYLATAIYNDKNNFPVAALESPVIAIIDPSDAHAPWALLLIVDLDV